MKRIRSLRDAEKQLEILREHIKKTKGSGAEQSKSGEETTEETTRKKENKYKKRRMRRNAAEELVKMYDLTKKRQRTGNLENLQMSLSSSPLRPLPQLPIEEKKEMKEKEESIAPQDASSGKIKKQRRRKKQQQQPQVSSSVLRPLPEPPAEKNTAPLNGSNAKPEKIKPKDDEHLSKLQPPLTSEETNSQPPATNQPVVRVNQPEKKEKEEKEENKEMEDIEEKDITIIEPASLTTAQALRETQKKETLEEFINRLENGIRDYPSYNVSFANRDFRRMRDAIDNLYMNCIYRLKSNLTMCIRKYKQAKTLDTKMIEVQKLKEEVDACKKITADLQNIVDMHEQDFIPIFNLAKNLLNLVGIKYE